MNIFKIFNKKHKMKSLIIDETNAKKSYKLASPEFKLMLENTFGKDFFSQKITDRIKTIKDACEELGENYDELMNSIRSLSKDERSYICLKVVIKALNEDWTANWNDNSEYKYFPWFDMSKKPGSGFNNSYYHDWSSSSYVSSHLWHLIKNAIQTLLT